MKAFIVNVNELSPKSKLRWLLQKQIADDCAYAEQLQHQWDTECRLLIAATNKRQPGRPRKVDNDTILHLTTPPEQASAVEAPNQQRIH